jgi:flavorubredoxin
MALRYAGGCMTIVNPLPRKLMPGVWWLGQCQAVVYGGQPLHFGNSVFLVAGAKHSALIDTGQTYNVPSLMDQIERVLTEDELPPVRYVFITHSEIAHSGGTGHALERFGDAVAYGEVSDLHLIFPQFADRFVLADPGETFDLGGRSIRVVEAVIRDMTYSRWFFDTGERVLFSGDGFAFTHNHSADHCGHLAEEIEGISIAEQVAVFSRSALPYMRSISMEPLIERIDALMNELDVALIAPTHGLPIGNPHATLPALRDGFRLASATSRAS